MDDTISRQAAIDTLNDDAELLRRALDDVNFVGAEREKYEWGLGLIESNISDMKELPSAQPKKTGWEIFDVCPPEEDGVYIVTDSTGEVFPAEYDAEGEEPGTLVGMGRRMHWTDIDTGVGLFDEEVTAWMELPDPFEG